MQDKSHFIVFGQLQVKQEETDEVVDAMRNAWLGAVPEAIRFERSFANYNCAAAARFGTISDA